MEKSSKGEKNLRGRKFNRVGKERKKREKERKREKRNERLINRKVTKKFTLQLMIVSSNLYSYVFYFL